jgi:hypothetical protein
MEVMEVMAASTVGNQDISLENAPNQDRRDRRGKRDLEDRKEENAGSSEGRARPALTVRRVDTWLGIAKQVMVNEFRKAC